MRAVRILADDVEGCYTALGLVHELWPTIESEFDDYIAHPKSNNYRSLHTAVTGPRGLALEVQIRTVDMHKHAELGVAAHWRYKEGAARDAAFDRKIEWLRELLAVARAGPKLGTVFSRQVPRPDCQAVYADALEFWSEPATLQNSEGTVQ